MRRGDGREGARARWGRREGAQALREGEMEAVAAGWDGSGAPRNGGWTPQDSVRGLATKWGESPDSCHIHNP